VIAELRSYFGVTCFRCGEPILVSAKVVGLQEEIARRETNAPLAFVARCRRCELESVYAIRQVQKFEGEPRSRISRRTTGGGTAP
jgi:hypothetical protein